MKTLTKIVVLALFAILVAVGYVAASYFLTIPTNGYIETEYGLTATPTSISWGPPNMTIGAARTKSVDIINTGTRNFTSLNIQYSSETSNLLNFTLECDAVGLPLPIGKSVVANFTLTIYEATQGDFSFNIYVSDES